MSMPHPIFLNFWTPNRKNREFKWLHHITHLLWYSQPYWHPQDFLMKPVNIHHILNFFLLHCTQVPIISISKTTPPRCPCRTQFFLLFGHQSEKQPRRQSILAIHTHSITFNTFFAWQGIDFDTDSAMKKIRMSSKAGFDDVALVE